MAHHGDRHHGHNSTPSPTATPTPAAPASDARETTLNDDAGDNPVMGRASNDNIIDIGRGDAEMQPKAAFSEPASTTPWAPR
jgi:hypothetical protein